MRSKLLFLTINIVAAFAFFWPFLRIGRPVSAVNGGVFSALVVAIAFLIIAVEISRQLLDSKTIAVIGVLAAVIAALRLLGAGAIGIEPIWFLLIISARVFGAKMGYALGIIALATSALLTGGVGPWLSFQMFAAGWVAAMTVVIPASWRGKREVLALALYGVVTSLIFGALMDLQLWPWLTGIDTQLSFNADLGLSDNLARFFAFHFATAMAWDLPRAIITAILTSLTAHPLLNSLRRARRRLAFTSPEKAPTVISR